jgi:para-aminobenzoate synthetase component I
VENERLTYQVGAGIVADSIPQQEWEETLHKAAGILQACENLGPG